MHTFTYDSYRIHHNGGFDGDIIITYKPSDEEWVDTKTTSEFILDLVKNNYNRISNDFLVNFKGTDKEDKEVIFGVPFEVFVSFVADRYVRRGLESWLDSADEKDLIRLIDKVETGLC